MLARAEERVALSCWRARQLQCGMFPLRAWWRPAKRRTSRGNARPASIVFGGAPMHDEHYWLKHPILPRPPALPKFGRELCALLGLEPSEYERDSASNGPKSEAASAPECGDTRPDALAAGSELRTHAGLARTGT